MIEAGSSCELTKRAYCKNKLYIEDTTCCFTKTAPDDTKVFCCRCAHKRRASPLTCFAICFLVLTYNLLGGFLFLALEGNLSQAEETSVAASKPNLSQSQGISNNLRSKTVERLWSITEDLNILYKENWTKLAAKELMDFQKTLVSSMRGAGPERRPAQGDADGYRWTFSTSFLYALTLITTIGHGNVTPKSSVGKLVAVAYACVGIPIITLYLATLGDALARAVRALYSRVRPRSAADFHLRQDCLNRFPASECNQLVSDYSMDYYAERQKQTPFQAALNLDSFSGGHHWTCRGHARAPAALGVLLVALYVALGTLVFHSTEQWSLVDGCLFSFSSLATVGFGSLRPGAHARTVSPRAEDVAVGVCCIYILVGMVVVAMSFNLIQEELSVTVRGLTGLWSGGGSRAVHGTEHARRAALTAAS